MKNDLSCAVVRDLLPSYVDGLTSEETSHAVKAHLDSCPQCTSAYHAMSEPDQTFSTSDTKEVDYLKTVRRKGRNKIVLAVLSVLLILALGGAAKVFLIGSPAVQIYGRPVYHTAENTMELNFSNPNSGKAYAGWKVDTTDGVVTVTAREVLSSPIHSSGDYDLSIPMDGVREVHIFGQLVWQDGLFIDPVATALCKARTPYAGSPSALGALSGPKGVLSQYLYLPPLSHTHELQTAAEPYGWTLHYEEDPGPWANEMETSAFLLLALVDNMGQVSWTWPNSDQVHTLTLDEANAALPALVDRYNEDHNVQWQVKGSVKEYADTPYSMQQLLLILGKDSSASRLNPPQFVSTFGDTVDNDQPQ